MDERDSIRELDRFLSAAATCTRPNSSVSDNLARFRIGSLQINFSRSADRVTFPQSRSLRWIVRAYSAKLGYS
jgi:hypothetical protein